MPVKTPPKKRRKPGPPRTTGPGEQVVVRLHQPLLGFIDEWRFTQNGELSRAEAIRRLATLGVKQVQAESDTARPRKSKS
jgi:hypothetical protein